MNYDIELDRIDTTDDVLTRMRALVESLEKVQQILYDIDKKTIKSNAKDNVGVDLSLVSVKLETNGTLTFTMNKTVDASVSPTTDQTEEITNLGTGASGAASGGTAHTHADT